MTEIPILALSVSVAVLVILITIMVSVAFSRNKGGLPLPNASMASSSPSSPSAPASSSSRSWKYDVFLSFRGEDTRKTFVDHLYNALVERPINVYKDDETLSRGDSISPSLFKAIEESYIAIIIFSENYADSSWCLDELAYIMQCRNERGQIVIPIFYDVDPSEVRKQKGNFGKAFTKQKQKNITKFESWKQALVDASNIAGWEPKHIAGGHEAKCIKDIVGTILDKLLSVNSVIDKNLVGMETRLQDLKSRLVIGSDGVLMVGIWGIGGGGKTTLASSLYIEIDGKFDSCCFLGNIKNESVKHGMETLQEKLLLAILKTKVEVPSIDIGKQMIKSRLCHRNVLIFLDDIDDRKQLEALAGSHDWFGDGSRIVITTRNEQLLITHRVDQVYPISLLSDEAAIQLFNKYAYNENNLVQDYIVLSQHVVTYACGLPLALVVLGSFLYDKNTNEWISTLTRLKDIPEMEIIEKLKISYDGLKPLEKELFLDIACFYRGCQKDSATEMLDACGFHPGIGVKVLMQKALITISSELFYSKKLDVFDMHDLIQEMAHYIVRGEHTKNPEKYNRLWKEEEIEDMCYGNEMENVITEAIICKDCPLGFDKLVSRANKLRLLMVDEGEDIKGPNYISNELRYLLWVKYPASTFPESFQPRKLVVLNLRNSLQKEIWKGYKFLPCLKELEISESEHLIKTPDFGGLPCLQKLTLDSCGNLEEIHPSLGNHTSLVYAYVKFCTKLRKFPTIVHMGKLKTLEIFHCTEVQTLKIESNMDSLVNLYVGNVGIEALPSTVGKFCTNLRSLKLENCLKSIEGNFHSLKHLEKCTISVYRTIVRLPKDLFHENSCLQELHLNLLMQPSIPYLPRFLKRLILSRCGLKDGEIPCDIGELSNLQELDLSDNKFSRLNFSLSQLTQLRFLDLRNCPELVELPELPSNIAILKADRCESLEVVGDINTNCKWLCHVSLMWVRSVIYANRLLQSMLQGNAIENHSMVLKLEGVEIPNGFSPCLLRGRRFRLKLPENWYNDFSGFLMCAALLLKNYMDIDQYVSIKHEKGSSTGMDSQRKVYWEESVGDKGTWVGYVSFGSLKHTLWWDPTSTAVEFSIYGSREPCSGFGVGLVSKTSRTETTTTSSDDYTCNFSIEDDSKSHLMGRFSSNDR